MNANNLKVKGLIYQNLTVHIVSRWLLNIDVLAWMIIHQIVNLILTLALTATNDIDSFVADKSPSAVWKESLSFGVYSSGGTASLHDRAHTPEGGTDASDKESESEMIVSE